MNIFSYYFTLLLIFVPIVGCSPVKQPTSPESLAILEKAKMTYEQASAHPKTDPITLEKAQQALVQAEQATDEATKAHFAYLAQKQAEISLTIAQRHQLITSTETEKKVSPSDELQQQWQSQLHQWPQQSPLVLTLPYDKAFENGQLSSDTTNLLGQVAQYLQQHSKLHMVLTGYANNPGDRQHNLGLSERWATSVKFVLINLGIPSHRLLIEEPNMLGHFGEPRVELTISIN